MRRLPSWVVWLLALIGLVRRPPRERTERPQIVPPGEPSPRAELVVVALLVLCALAAALFVVLYAVGASTQALGGALAGALALLAAALILAARTLVVTEELGETYPDAHPQAQEEVAAVVEQSGSRVTRKRLLTTAAGVAAGTLGVAFVTPALSLGPALDTDRLLETPWRRGRRLVDDAGRPLRAADITTDAFYTAFPEGASEKEIGSPVVVVRVDPAQLRLPPGRAGWAPGGILAFSKICTHAGCAVALYRKPTFGPVEPQRALVCPCHYSTFDPARGGAVTFGPAGRPLPQLPLIVDAAGELRAGGNFSAGVGPGWGRVRDKPISS